ncbi:hypothetical protein [Streptomyces sp. NPDC127112]|uniref:hypothetical protein n=1 Tax=Streptomyces sp. NPDC127112 TaxID=3345364 RepID=UPI003633B5CA
MVTARSPRVPRVRSRAGLSQLLGLALLLLGLICAHGTGGSHSATGHSTPYATARTTVMAAATVAADATDPALTPGAAALPVRASGTPSGLMTRTDAAPPAGPAPAAPAAGRHDPAHPVHECAPLPPRAAHSVDAPPAPAAPLSRCAPSAAPGAGEAPRAAGPAGHGAPPRTQTPTVLRV